jgi:hypothetical protein
MLLVPRRTAPQGSDQRECGIDPGDVLNASTPFMNAKKQARGNSKVALEALMLAVSMGQKPLRQHRGQIVANALLQAIAGMAKQ